MGKETCKFTDGTVRQAVVGDEDGLVDVGEEGILELDLFLDALHFAERQALRVLGHLAVTRRRGLGGTLRVAPAKPFAEQRSLSTQFCSAGVVAHSFFFYYFFFKTLLGVYLICLNWLVGRCVGQPCSGGEV